MEVIARYGYRFVVLQLRSPLQSEVVIFFSQAGSRQAGFIPFILVEVRPLQHQRNVLREGAGGTVRSGHPGGHSHRLRPGVLL